MWFNPTEPSFSLEMLSKIKRNTEQQEKKVYNQSLKKLVSYLL